MQFSIQQLLGIHTHKRGDITTTNTPFILYTEWNEEARDGLLGELYLYNREADRQTARKCNANDLGMRRAGMRRDNEKPDKP
jgi:hypothetical protein